ncbi:hypothetical protein [Deinococcus maricopensis]|uniref:Uncharacterized protein n=1 Tax=Deinococcus maricopensis (strain DSM 21211 / LMG 22137 / NRRL B-23946 / LB-34) TaxID=709986 RepID=E8UAL7_DEIML|nr:hypothetical protein [Deinococcus maricopensis]ADV68106.1 hypothetical protein Deima_2471 [Deinococcus maricopensis DSM 21211]
MPFRNANVLNAAILGGLDTTLLIPAAQHPNAGALTQALPTLVPGIALPALIISVAATRRPRT